MFTYYLFPNSYTYISKYFQNHYMLIVEYVWE